MAQSGTDVPVDETRHPAAIADLCPRSDCADLSAAIRAVLAKVIEPELRHPITQGSGVVD